MSLSFNTPPWNEARQRLPQIIIYAATHTLTHTETEISLSTLSVCGNLAEHVSFASTSGIEIMPDKYLVKTSRLPPWCHDCLLKVYFVSLMSESWRKLF